MTKRTIPWLLALILMAAPLLTAGAEGPTQTLVGHITEVDEGLAYLCTYYFGDAWLVLPEGVSADAYVGENVRVTLADVRAERFANFGQERVAATAIETLPGLSAQVRAIGTGYIDATILNGSSLPGGGADVRIRLGDETVICNEYAVGSSIHVVVESLEGEPVALVVSVGVG